MPKPPTWAKMNSISLSTFFNAPNVLPSTSNGNQSTSQPSPQNTYLAAPSTTNNRHRICKSRSKSSDAGKRDASKGAASVDQYRRPNISRKVKACAACRRQKIKCLMGPEDLPPCQRCRERGLSCHLNKSLQTLMSEDSRWKISVARDMGNIHAAVQQVLQSLSLPSLSELQPLSTNSAIQLDADQQEAQENLEEDEDNSCDESLRGSSMVGNVAQAPMESLYQITGLKSLHSIETITEGQNRICKQLRDTDFISRNQISLQDAEKLADYYLRNLDSYAFGMTAHYKSLEDFRRGSPTLTAAVLAVAAKQDASAKMELYPRCSKEFKRLVANAMFERKIDMEYLRALVIGSFWLADIGWVLSGYAIRRANEFHLKTCYHQIADSLKHPNKYSFRQLCDSRDGLRLLYLLYICDHHFSLYYGRPSMMSDSECYIVGLDDYLASCVAGHVDNRMASHVALLVLMSRIKECLTPEGPNFTLSVNVLPMMMSFERDLDRWATRWSITHNATVDLGTFSLKAVYVQNYFCKTYLDAFVFCGLSDNATQSAVIPEAFVETASAGVSAAVSMVNLILDDDEIWVGLASVPHYFYGMIAFSSVFLVKAAARHNVQLQIDQSRIRTLVECLSNRLSTVQVGHDHVVHRMARGLWKMAESLAATNSQSSRATAADKPKPRDTVAEDATVLTNPSVSLEDLVLNPFATTDGTDFSLGDFNMMGVGMPFIDLEGNSECAYSTSPFLLR